MDHLADAKQLFLEALALQEKGDLERAEGLYRKALTLAPERPSVMNNLAAVLFSLKKYSEAKLLCERLLAIDPADATALLHLGNCQAQLDLAGEALIAYDKALMIRPDYADALTNRGNALLALKRPEEALASHERALAVIPDHVTALNNRGIALWHLGRREEASASWDHALRIKPDYAEPLFNRGDLRMLSGEYDKAIEDFERLLTIDPEYDNALGNVVHCRMHVCDWSKLARDSAALSARVQDGKRAAAPFTLLATYASPAEQLQCARIWANDKHPPSSNPLWLGDRYQHDRIRIAYMSGEFREHATSYLIAGLLELHDTSRFQIFAISTGVGERGSTGRRIERACEHFMDVSNKPDREVASRLRDHEIDILVNLNGYFGTARTGICAMRAAPVQVNYLGFPGTMGANYMDYIIADRHVIPEDQRKHFSEQVVYLPDTYQANDSKRKVSPLTPSRAEVGLPDHGFVFCCFNNNHKILPDMFDIWMRLLSKIENSVLWLLQDNVAVSKNLRREAQARSVAPERLIFAPRVKMEDHLARHRLADLFLDTLPHNAHTTASDALWTGLPVLTIMGNSFAGRVAGSLLYAVGLPELITNTREDYEALALKLAIDDGLLADVKARLARNRATYPLFNTDRYRKHIESAYVTMWERYQRGEPPESFAVPALF